MPRDSQVVDIFSQDRFGDIVQDRLDCCRELHAKRGFVRCFVEFWLRLAAASSNACWKSPNQSGICHYFHDVRLRRFEPTTTNLLCTEPKTRRLVHFRVTVAARILTRTVKVLLHTRPKNGIGWLVSLDLGCILEVIESLDIKHFHVSAHFQPYVILLSELRRHGRITSLTGQQHGAWEQKPLTNAKYRVPFDEYCLLHERFEQPFWDHFCDNPHASVSVCENVSKVDWQRYPEPHIALAFQNDDYESDFSILRQAKKICDEFGVQLLVYPHPVAPEAVIREAEAIAHVSRAVRYGNSTALITRYSTLGFQFAADGKTAVFVEVDGKRIVMDETGLNVHHVPLHGLASVIASLLTTSDEAPVSL